MGDKDFILAGDGWVQVTPCGEFPHVGAGVTQVIDREACDRIAADFNGRKADANFPGVLVDFDHFSLDTGQSSEAAGWICVHRFLLERSKCSTTPHCHSSKTGGHGMPIAMIMYTVALGMLH